jgi:alanyl-tRNA synthetase
LVNQKISEDLPVTHEEMTYAEAIAAGGLAFGKEKYPIKVSVYSIGAFSKEICGGPHVQHTGVIGHFKIVAEKSSSAGIRRIKAIVEP